MNTNAAQSTETRRNASRNSGTAEATVKRLKRRRVNPDEDYRPILWMCYMSLLTLTCMFGSMFCF